MTTVSSLSSGLSSGTSSLTNALSGTSSSSSSTSTNLSNALSGNSASTIGDATSQALQQISDQIAALTAAASGDVQEFEKTSQDVLYDNNATARSIGQLRLNQTRLSAISALTQGDKVDVFSVNVATRGATKISLLVNDPSASDQTADASGKVRIQVFSKGTGLVADSDPGAGTAYQNYQALKQGTFDLASGQYSIRVSRADGADTQAKNTYNYALQITQGTKYTQDYTTTEQAYTAGTDDPFGLTNSSNSQASILSDALSDAYSYVSSLPAIGTSGTSKLLGLIYTGII